MLRWVVSASLAAIAAICTFSIYARMVVPEENQASVNDAKRRPSLVGKSRSHQFRVDDNLSAAELFDIYHRPSPPISKIKYRLPTYTRPVFEDVKPRKPSLSLRPGNLFEINLHKQAGYHERLLPPKFPPGFLQGDYSGYCAMKFDVSVNGNPFNVTAILCTDEQLKSASIKSVLKGRYSPSIKDGIPHSTFDEEIKIRFEIFDERGRALPLPPGY